MITRIGFLLGVVLSSAARSASAQISEPAENRLPNTTPSYELDHAKLPQMLESLPVEDLIAKLQEESNQGIGTHATAWASGFLAIDDEPRFQGGIIGASKPQVSLVMREIVRRGVVVLPVLMDHLNDARPTKLTVGDGFMARWFSDEYDPRHPEPGRQRAGVNTKAERRFDTYVLKVGDLCFVAIGQIVNRRLNAVRYQPSLCLVVNSPVETPALADAVKADWNGLSPGDHQHSLELDAINPPDVFDPAGGLKRLSFYYPDAGNPLIVKMLNRPLYDHRLVFEFFSKTMVSEKNDSRRNVRMATFRKEHGEVTYHGLLACLVGISAFPESQMSPERRRDKEIADKMLHRYFPEVDPRNPPFLNAADIHDQKELVEDLAAIRFPEMEEAVLGVLRRSAVMRPMENAEDRVAQYDLACACAQRLMDRAKRDAAFSSRLKTALVDFRKAHEGAKHSTGTAVLDARLKKMLQALDESSTE